MGLFVMRFNHPAVTSKLLPCTAPPAHLQAAVRWPEITVLAAFGCAIIAAVRTAALALVMAKYTPGSGKATMVSRGAAWLPACASLRWNQHKALSC